MCTMSNLRHHNRPAEPSAFRFDEAHYENRNLTNGTISNDNEQEFYEEEYLSADSQEIDDVDDISSSEGDDHYFDIDSDGKNKNNKMLSAAARDPPPPPPGRPDKRKDDAQRKQKLRNDRAANADKVEEDTKQRRPSLEPYLTRLEKFEFFSTPQCYYLVACDKHSTGYRIMKMDRTLVERPTGTTGGFFGVGGGSTTTVAANSSSGMGDSSNHTNNVHRDGTIPPTPSTNTSDASTLTGEEKYDNKTASSPQNQQQQPPPPLQQSQNQQTFRRLSEFVFEDPAVYTQSEIKDILDMINDGNRNGMGGTPSSSTAAASSSGEVDYPHHQHLYGGSGSSSREYDTSSHYSQGGPSDQSINRAGSVGSMSRQGGGGGHNSGGLKPICKAYGLLGFIRFLDCYYLTLITKRAKVGSIGGNSIYTIKSTETFPLKPAERSGSSSAASDNPGHDPLGLLSMWQRGKRSVGLGLTNREIAELRYQGELRIENARLFIILLTFTE